LKIKSRSTKKGRSLRSEFPALFIKPHSPQKMQSAAGRQVSPFLPTHSPNRSGSISFKAYLLVKENALCSKPISNICHAPASILVE